MMRLDVLRRYAVARSLFAPTTLRRAIERLGFVQADPIRAPARAQDLILRHRVRDYRAGDLERRYPFLALEEDYFVNYGFLPRNVSALLQARPAGARKGSVAHRRMADLLEFARDRGEVHPRAAAAHFAHGRVTNYWGGGSNATTQLLDRMHYHGLLRVARRDKGIRVYAPREDAPLGPKSDEERAPATGAVDPQQRADALLRRVVQLYAPLTGAGLAQLTGMLVHAAPQLKGELKTAWGRARQLFGHASVDAQPWYWPADESPQEHAMEPQRSVRLLAPFDPVVWDRRRFERFWGWAYRFEAYTPLAQRKLGYYALPLLWRDRAIGWANLTVEEGRVRADVGYADGRGPRDGSYRRQLAAELDRIAQFLHLGAGRR